MAKSEENTETHDTFPSFIQGHTPIEEDIQFTIGPYQVLKSLGKGGMGEVLLAYDTKCGRRVALKKIRADLLEHKNLQRRFLKEAHITSQLTHPAIMPIYTIQDENEVVYYTMPFVQGETLKQILRQTRDQEKKGEKLHHIGGSIPSLVRIFITVCQAIAYSHSKGVLHRDLKPENIIIGRYGEALILDWGLAKLIGTKDDDGEDMGDELTHPFHELTRAGKVVGTVSYMAPERARGETATVLTEIYSFGVILYQILTLKNPFARGTLEEFRKKMDKETLEDPIDIAPYRDIPRLLQRICLKCLEIDPQNRYQTVDELIRELENYIEGRPEWFQITELNIDNKSDWQFQENILIAEHIAITRGTEHTAWVSLMISNGSFTGNTKIEANVTIGENGEGIGFLMSIPEEAERRHVNDGYCLWLGSDINKTTQLLRSTVEVIHAPEIFLTRGKTYRVKIEKIDQNLYFYLDDVLQFSYISHVPLVGTHIGLLSKDADFTLEDFTIFVGSQNIMVNCLSVPDAFLAHKNYPTALNEYRRIGYSFPGRAEGREAMFRAGITLLEQAKETDDEALFDATLEEFEKLHSTPGAPLEYLGKAHVYKAMGDPEEEIKCYEMGFRRYPHHPLLSVLEEQLIYRMHETSRIHRKATYQFMLTALKHLPDVKVSNHTKKLFDSLQKHWEPLYFIEEDPNSATSEILKNIAFGIQLAFWVANPFSLLELIDEAFDQNPTPVLLIGNALFCLIKIDSWEMAKQRMEELPVEVKTSHEIELVQIAILGEETSPEKALDTFLEKKRPRLDKGELRLLFHLLEKALCEQNTNFVFHLLEKVEHYDQSDETKLRFECCRIWALLLNQDFAAAGHHLHQYPLNLLTSEESLLYILYGCWLSATESQEIAKIHFAGVLDMPLPPSWTLLSHYVNGKLPVDGLWFQKAFLWEKMNLRCQLILFFTCIGEPDKADYWERFS